MGFTLQTAVRLAVRLLLATTTISSALASPSIHDSYPDSTGLDLDNYEHYDKLPQLTQEEYLALNNGVDPTLILDDEGKELKSRQNPGYTPVTGIPGTCQHRRKIEVLQANFPAEFNLFMLALENIQKITETDSLSWYQIMGIHGLPHIPWGQPAQGNYDFSTGYCPHTSPIFCSWHRPYLLLMEQWIQEKARRIALQFNGTARATYTDAATRVRLAYWDWADPGTQSNVPPIAMQTTVRVIKPNPGQTNPVTVTIANPLYQYVFKNRAFQNQFFDGNFQVWTSTRRQPDSQGNSNNQLASSIMQSGYTGRRQDLYMTLGSTTYASFNDAIEGIHNGVHVNMGGDNGHMSFLDYSAFDPIFFLHHANVDRLFAMWQATHPGVYLQPSTATDTFGRNIDPATCGCTDNLGTALFPFHLSNGQWWKTQHIRDARNIWQYGHGYDDVPCSYQSRSSSDLRTFVNTRINTLYGPTQATGVEVVRSGGGPGSATSPDSETVTAASDNHPATSNDKTDGASDKPKKVRKEWVVRYVMDKAAIPGSWKATFFYGDAPASVQDYALATNKVGAISGLGSYVSDNSSPTMMKASKPFIKDLPFTEALIATGLVSESDYKPENLVKSLKAKFTWRITRQGKLLDISTIPTLKIAVYETTVKYPLDSDLGDAPTYGPAKYKPDITTGKPGGISSAKDMDVLTLVNGKSIPIPDAFAAK